MAEPSPAPMPTPLLSYSASKGENEAVPEKFIAGGAFSTEPGTTYIKDGYTAQEKTVDGKTVYEVVKETCTVTFAPNGGAFTDSAN